MKILYGVPGEGMGHATRSKVIIAHLLENHDVKIVSSSRAFQFLEKSFPGRAVEIEGFHIAYEKGEVSKFKTFTETLFSGPQNLTENFHKYREIIKSFTPDLVISDFESFSYFFAKFNKIPIINIDNMQVIDRCKLEIEIPAEEKVNYQIAKNIIKLKVPNCNRYFITTFFRPPAEKENTQYIPPILRDEIIRAETSVQNHVLVYQTSTSQNDLTDILQTLPDENFYVYGFNQDKTIGNVILKKFSETGFISDLASAKAVISNGGFSLISEAVYLKKPVCSFPVKNQFEQFVNAAYINRLGYGKHLNELSGDGIKSFLYDLKYFTRKIAEYRQNGNNETFAAVDESIKTFDVKNEK
jgi:uncharacterized protein (TIGR00661 family)